MEHKRTVMKAISRTRHAWGNHMRALAMELGIPNSYREIIQYLCRRPGANQSNIADFCGITTSAINQTVKSMIEEGYVHKETDSADRRHTRLYLTDKGATIAHQLHEKLQESDGVITAVIGPEKEAELIALLDKIHDCIKEDLSC